MSPQEKPKEQPEQKQNNSPKKPDGEPILEGEVFEKLPDDVKKVVEMGLSIQRYSGPFPNPIMSKLNEKHIDKILELSEKDDEHKFETSKSNRKYNLIYVLIFSALLIFLTIFLVQTDKELYKEILKLLVVYFGGLGSGYGLRRYLEKTREE